MNKVQKVIFNIFLQIAEVLNSANIDYYAVGGTCLGAVRHKGFIPWDDDIDIAIKIEDFDRALELLAKTLPDYYSVRFFPGHSHYTIMHAKVIDERTTFIEESEYKYKDAYKGCFVDIMPLSGVPNGYISRKLFCKRISAYRIFNQIRRLDWDTIDTKAKKIIHPLFRKFDWLIPEDYYSRKWYNLLRKHPFNESDYVGYVWWWELERLIYKREVFGKPTPYKFEESTISCPEDAEALLKQQFNNYMMIPPKEKQYGHYVGTVDLEHSYHEYVEGKHPLHMM